MKNLMLTLVLLVGSYSYAYSTKYFNISTGKTKIIDVANQKNVISLKWEVTSSDGFIIPSAKVIQQEGDFTCDIKDTILLFSGYSANNSQWNQVWEIKIEWQPGTDLSSCLVEINHPDEGSAFAKISMNYGHYGFKFRSTKKETPNEGNGSCETYECDDNGDRDSDNGGPDGTSDGPSRDSGGSYDGGDYSGI